MLTLTRQALPAIPALTGSQHTWPLRVTCAKTNNGDPIPPEIFVFHAQSLDGTSANDLFECIASVHQLSDIPKSAPHKDTEPGKSIPYYRLSVLTFHCLSVAEHDQLWNDIKEDVDDLVENFQLTSQLLQEEVYVA